MAIKGIAEKRGTNNIHDIFGMSAHDYRYIMNTQANETKRNETKRYGSKQMNGRIVFHYSRCQTKLVGYHKSVKVSLIQAKIHVMLKTVSHKLEM